VVEEKKEVGEAPTASLEEELRRELEEIRKGIENGSIADILGNAIDYLLIFTPKRELVGFDILITFGGPNIRWVSVRGACELVGSWGGTELKLSVSPDRCEKALEYMEAGLFNPPRYVDYDEVVRNARL
jgi:hypothetical protein